MKKTSKHGMSAPVPVFGMGRRAGAPTHDSSEVGAFAEQAVIVSLFCPGLCVFLAAKYF